jgi:hypothetical protein
MQNDIPDINELIDKMKSGYQPLNEMNTNDLLKKINDFKKIDLKHTSYQEISHKIVQTISALSIPISYITDNTPLFRVRKLKPDLSNQLVCIQDVWYPKAEYLTADGRANLQGQPMLYCALDPVTAIIECGVEQDEWYAMIMYRVKPDHKIQASSLVNEQLPPGLTLQGEVNHRIISDFITSEFCKPVGKGTEYLYKISNVICSDFFDVPNCDGYLYPSVSNYKKGTNVAIKPQAVDEHLNFDCVRICQGKEGYNFKLLHEAHKVENGVLIYNF